MAAKKLVEVEGNELAFTKQGKKFKLKSDFKGGPSHKEGGIPYVATEGEVIFPKQQREKILDLYNQGNDTQLEKARKKLPKDTPKLANGTGGITPTLREQLKYRTPENLEDPGLLPDTPTVPNGKNAIESLFNPLKPDPYAGGEPSNPFPKDAPTNPLTIDQLMTGASTGNPGVTPEVPGEEQGVGSNLAGKIGMYGNAAYNLFKGLGPSEKVERNYVTPQLLKYQDSSAPDRRNSLQARNLTKSNARNLSGGNASRVQASLQQAENENLDHQASINNTEYGRAQAIQNANAEIKNQAAYTNTNLRNSYNDTDMRSSAAKRGFMGAAINEATGQAKQNLMDQAQRDADGKKLNFYDSLFSNYKVKRDANGNPVGIQMK